MEAPHGQGPAGGPGFVPDSDAAGVPANVQEQQRTARGRTRERGRILPLERRLGAEAGFALPVAIAVLFLAGGLATVAAKAAISASAQSLRDSNVKRAHQAAGAGIRAAMYQTNLMQPRTSECVVKDASGTLALAAVQTDGWCASQSETLESGATYTLRISSARLVAGNGQNLTERRIVSTGTVNGVKRRILVTTTASTGAPLFPAQYAAVSLDSVTMGNSVQIGGGLGSNGHVTLSNSAEVCGPATPGVGKSLTLNNSASVCPGFPTTPAVTPFSLPPVDQTGAVAQNDNGRICATGALADPCTGDVSWNPATRVLRITNTGTLTLAGDIYSLCRIELRNTARLRIAVRSTPLRIFLDTPENCGSSSGMGSFKAENNTTIENLNTDPTTLQMFVAGSPSRSTSVEFENSGSPAENTFMSIYAPSSTVEVENYVQLTGAIAAKSVRMENNTTLTYDDRVTDIDFTNQARIFQNPLWQECAASQSGSLPETGC